MKIFFKLGLLLLLLTIIPLGALGIVSQNHIISLQESAVHNLNQMAGAAVTDSTQSLDKIGTDMIQLVARDVAKELEIFIRAHPEMTVADLQGDEYFKSLAVQQVGKTGYTAVTDSETLVCRFHSNPKIADMDLHLLAEKLPGFWGVMSRTEGGIAAEGIYDWEEADGSIREKYMFIQPVNATTADGVVFTVAATTYLDEFNAPASAISNKMAQSLETVTDEMHAGAEKMRSRNMFFLLFMVIAVLVAGFFFAHSITEPLNKLSAAGKKVADGDLDTELPKISSHDEVRDIGETLSMLIGAVKFLKKEKSEKK